jgi:hypothetical protein
VLESLAHGGNPFTKTVLDGRELGELTSVIGVHTERLGVTELVFVSTTSLTCMRQKHEAHLVEVSIEAAFELLVHVFVDRVTSLVPESGEVARLVVLVARGEVEVSSVALPDDVVFIWLVWCRLVEVAFEAHEVTHAEAC